MEPGFAIYDFRGHEIFKQQVDKLKQVIWRPRPRSLLSRDDVKKVRRNLRESSRVFEEQDALEESNVSAELIAHRRRLVDEWNSWRRSEKERLEQEREAQGKKIPRALANALGLNTANEEVTQEVEEVLEETEEVLA